MKCLSHSLRSALACGFACVISLSSIAMAQDAPKGKSLFDGKTLQGWSGLPANWSVQDGAITGENKADAPIKNNTFIVYEKNVGDFELNLEFKISGGNSGIQYRSKLLDKDKFIVGGYQADIDSQKRYMGINYEEQGRGILAERGDIILIDSKGDKKKVGSAGDAGELTNKFNVDDWNKYRVVAKGNVVQHFINGVLMSEVRDEQSDKAASSGVLALQLHAGPPMKVQFKNIMLSE